MERLDRGRDKQAARVDRGKVLKPKQTGILRLRNADAVVDDVGGIAKGIALATMPAGPCSAAWQRILAFIAPTVLPAVINFVPARRYIVSGLAAGAARLRRHVASRWSLLLGGLSYNSHIELRVKERRAGKKCRIPMKPL